MRRPNISLTGNYRFLQPPQNAEISLQLASFLRCKMLARIVTIVSDFQCSSISALRRVSGAPTFLNTHDVHVTFCLPPFDSALLFFLCSLSLSFQLCFFHLCIFARPPVLTSHAELKQLAGARPMDATFDSQLSSNFNFYALSSIAFNFLNSNATISTFSLDALH